MTLAQKQCYLERIQTAKSVWADWSQRADTGEFDEMDDAEWEAAKKAALHPVYLAKMALYDANIKSIRPNDWFKSFLASFGNPDDDPEKEQCLIITAKQADVFRDKAAYDRGARCYLFRYDGTVYKVSNNVRGSAYLTIRRQFL